VAWGPITPCGQAECDLVAEGDSRHEPIVPYARQSECYEADNTNPCSDESRAWTGSGAPAASHPTNPSASPTATQRARTSASLWVNVVVETTAAPSWPGSQVGDEPIHAAASR
jgi:hypothetical protein